MARYANTGEFNVLYPTRRKMATILKRILRNDIVDGEGTLVESIRINAKITGFQKLEIQIVAMYYFIFLNNGAFLWNGGVITPRDYVAQFTDELNAAGITAEIYRQYTEWLTKKYPLVEAVEVLEKQQKIVYTFEAVDPPPGFTPGFPLDV
jgi:predicted lysophospholipase L1 biosynthesis ABC-type transport system permease subunit